MITLMSKNSIVWKVNLVDKMIKMIVVILINKIILIMFTTLRKKKTF